MFQAIVLSGPTLVSVVLAMKVNLTRPFNNSDKDISLEGVSKVNYYILEFNFIIGLCVINVILSITALFGNSVILIAIWKTSSLHSMANILLSSLAVSDLAVGLVAQPLFVPYLLSRLNAVFNVLGTFLIIASFMSITAIGVDRLLALQLHLRYEAVVTPFRVKLVLIFVWVFSAVVASSQLWVAGYLPRFFPSVIFICLLVGNFVVYFKIYLIVRRRQRQIQQQQQVVDNESFLSIKRSKKTALNTFLLYIILLFCYIPYSFSVQIGNAGIIVSPEVYVSTITVVFLNSSLNPLLYCWRDREIRTAVKQLLCH